MVCLVHAGGDEQAGGRGEGRDGPDGGADAEEVSEDAGEQRADGEPAVTPEPIDPDRLGSPHRGQLSRPGQEVGMRVRVRGERHRRGGGRVSSAVDTTALATRPLQPQLLQRANSC